MGFWHLHVELTRSGNRNSKPILFFYYYFFRILCECECVYDLWTCTERVWVSEWASERWNKTNENIHQNVVRARQFFVYIFVWLLFYSETFTEEKRSADFNNNCIYSNNCIKTKTVIENYFIDSKECNLITNLLKQITKKKFRNKREVLKKINNLRNVTKPESRERRNSHLLRQ